MKKPGNWKRARKVPHPSAPRYTERPIRFWDIKRKCVCRWYYYKDERRALDKAAATIANWAAPGEDIDVYHSITQRHLAQFVKQANGQVFVWKRDDGHAPLRSW